MTCIGACCAAFPLGGMTYRELEERYHRLTDGATIFDMVRPLTREEAIARRPDLADRDVLAEAYFRCVRWDEETRLCTRYDERPELCSGYPYAGTCEHDGCDHREPFVVRLRWVWLRSTRPEERDWSWDGFRWQPAIAPLTFPG